MSNNSFSNTNSFTGNSITSYLTPVPAGSTFLEKATVISNRDPDGIGRIQVRNVNRHGTNENGIKDEDLPWAEMVSFAGGFNSGSTVTPEEGVVVWITYENGDLTRPVCLGVARSSGNSQVTYQGTQTQRRFKRSDVSDVPNDYTSPDVKVLYKSTSGGKIVFDDTPNVATVDLKDATGQGLHLFPGVDDSTIRNDAFSYDTAEEQRQALKNSKVVLSSNGYNSLELSADDKNTSVNLTSGGSEEDSAINLTALEGKHSKINLSTSQGSETEINLSTAKGEHSKINIKTGEV